MELKMLAKDQQSGGNGCPAVYLGENGDVVVQGQVVDGDTFGNLANVLEGESAVRIAPEVILAAAEKLHG